MGEKHRIPIFIVRLRRQNAARYIRMQRQMEESLPELADGFDSLFVLDENHDIKELRMNSGEDGEEVKKEMKRK